MNTMHPGPLGQGNVSEEGAIAPLSGRQFKLVNKAFYGSHAGGPCVFEIAFLWWKKGWWGLEFSLGPLGKPREENIPQKD